MSFWNLKHTMIVVTGSLVALITFLVYYCQQEKQWVDDLADEIEEESTIPGKSMVVTRKVQDFYLEHKEVIHTVAVSAGISIGAMVKFNTISSFANNVSRLIRSTRTSVEARSKMDGDLSDCHLWPRELLRGVLMNLRYDNMIYTKVDSRYPIIQWLLVQNDKYFENYMNNDSASYYFTHHYKTSRRLWYAATLTKWIEIDDNATSYMKDYHIYTIMNEVGTIINVCARNPSHARQLYLMDGHTDEVWKDQPLLVNATNMIRENITSENVTSCVIGTAIGLTLVAGILYALRMKQERDLAAWQTLLFEAAEDLDENKQVSVKKLKKLLQEGKTKGARIADATRQRYIDNFINTHGIRGKDNNAIVKKMGELREKLRAEVEDLEEYYKAASQQSSNAQVRNRARQNFEQAKHNLDLLEISIEDVYNGEYDAATHMTRHAGKGKNKGKWQESVDALSLVNLLYQQERILECYLCDTEKKYGQLPAPLAAIRKRYHEVTESNLPIVPISDAVPDFKRNLAKIKNEDKKKEKEKGKNVEEKKKIYVEKKSEVKMEEARTSIPQINPQEIYKAIVPIYFNKDGQWHIYLFLTKIRNSEGIFYYTKEHARLKEDLRVYRDKDKKQLKPIDWSLWKKCGIDTIRIPDNKFQIEGVRTIDAASLIPNNFTIYTYDMTSNKEVQVSGDGTMMDDSGEYQHKLSTVQGQCGCPYVDNQGKVFALHGGANLTTKVNFGHLLISREMEAKATRDIIKLQASAYRVGTPRYKYKNLEYLCTAVAPRPVMTVQKQLLRFPSFLKKADERIWQTLEERFPSSYYAACPHAEAVWKSQLKMDQDDTFKPDPVFWDLAGKVVEQMYGPAMDQPPLDMSEVPSVIDMTKGPGFPWDTMGFKTREQLWKDPQFQEILKDPKHIPMYKVAPKFDEWYPKEKLEEDKCRTFIIPPLELLAHQIAMMWPINQASKNLGWTAYGFNPFNGGAASMAKKLDVIGNILFMWDWKEWDRLCRMHGEYETVKKHSTYPHKDYVAEHTCNAVIKLTNGDIVRRKNGNPSGSGSTTGDNCRTNTRYTAYVLIAAYYRKFQRLPSVKYIIDQMVFIYGDDVIGSVHPDFDWITDSGFMAQVIGSLGMILKEVKIGRNGTDFTLNDFTFLGFRFEKHPVMDIWLPRWSRERILTPVVWERIKKTDLEKYLCKLLSLTVLSFNDVEVFMMLKDLYSVMLNYASRETIQTPTVKALIRHGPLDGADVFAFYLGFECKCYKANYSMDCDLGDSLIFYESHGGGGPKTMASVITIFPPTVSPSGLLWLCTGTYQSGTTINIVGSGLTKTLAFQDWYVQLTLYQTQDINRWSPGSEGDDVHTEQKVACARTLLASYNDFKEGGFNPYGNGMILTFAQYTAKYRGSTFLKGKNAKETAAVYQQYVRAMRRKRKPYVRNAGVRVKRSYPMEGPSRKQNATEIGAPRQQRLPGNSRKGGGLSPCARKYAAAVANPFSMVDGSMLRANGVINNGQAFDPSDACIPSYPPLKSRRAKVFCSGQFFAGTDGRGFLAFAPRRLANNYSSAQFGPTAIIATAGSVTLAPNLAFGSLDDQLATNTQYTFNNFNSDYTLAALTTVNGRGIEYRVVAAGIRIRYTGPELQRSGTIYAIEHPEHDTLNGMLLNDVSQFESHFKCAVTRDWCTLTYTPVKNSEFQYGNDSYANAFNNDFSAHYLGFSIIGAPISAAGAFEYEAVALFEVTGQTVRDLKPAVADPSGLASVVNVITPNTQKMLNDSGPATVLNAITKGVSEISGMVEAGTKVAKLVSTIL